MKLADLTWSEVRESLEGKTSLIVPVGTCEQHGRHLPLNTDTLVAEYVADKLSEVSGFLVAPTVNYGVNLPCDRLFSGTCSLNEATLKTAMAEILEWWSQQGFQQYFIVSAHGDRFHLRALSGSCPKVHLLELYDLDLSTVLTRQNGARHACEAETSLMLYLFPSLVQWERVEDFETSLEAFEPYLNHLQTVPIPGSPGCQGFPSFATAEKGKMIYEMMMKKARQWIGG